MNRFLLWVVALLLACTGTGNQAEGATAPGPDGGSGGGTTKLALSTPAFKHSAAVPKKFTADQIWVLIRAIQVQHQILQLYIGQESLPV